MKILFKIVAYYHEENRIEVKFCDEKSETFRLIIIVSIP